MRLQGKTAIVTGGGTGIGRGIALAFAREGAQVIIANRTEKTGAGVVAEINKLGGKALFVPTDIARLTDQTHLVEETLRHFQKIDILVNNAGVSTLFAPFLEVTEEMFDTIINIDLRGTFFLSQKVGRVMVQQNYGKIINITTNITEIVQNETAPYAAAKAGLKTLTQNMAVELGKYHIQVNAIGPGEIYIDNTKFYFDDPAHKHIPDNIPLKRLGYPEDVASAALFLASNESDYITGITLIVDGGELLV